MKDEGITHTEEKNQALTFASSNYQEGADTNQIRTRLALFKFGYWEQINYNLADIGWEGQDC